MPPSNSLILLVKISSQYVNFSVNMKLLFYYMRYLQVFPYRFSHKRFSSVSLGESLLNIIKAHNSSLSNKFSGQLGLLPKCKYVELCTENLYYIIY